MRRQRISQPARLALLLEEAFIFITCIQMEAEESEDLAKEALEVALRKLVFSAIAKAACPSEKGTSDIRIDDDEFDNVAISELVRRCHASLTALLTWTHSLRLSKASPS